MRKYLVFWSVPFLFLGCSLWEDPIFGPGSGGSGGMTSSSSSSTSSTSSASSGASSSVSASTSASSSGGGPPSCPSMGAFLCDNNGVTPLVCDGTFHWGLSGGNCNFGCNTSTETCFCASPGRYILNPPAGSFTDTVTGLTYTLINTAVSAAQALCPAGGTLANLSQLKTLLAQQGPATECPSPDVDPLLFNVASFLGFKASSPTLCGGGYTTLDLNSGLTFCYGTIGSTPFHFLCVS